MKIDFKKKRLIYNNGSYMYWGIKRKKVKFKNKDELKLNITVISYLEEQIKALKNVITDQTDFIGNMQCYINALQEKCGIEPGRYCEIKFKDGTVKRIIRHDRYDEEIKYEETKEETRN